jgi:hypothetical protein
VQQTAGRILLCSVLEQGEGCRVDGNSSARPAIVKLKSLGAVESKGKARAARYYASAS